jgi:hypothetical protein
MWNYGDYTLLLASAGIFEQSVGAGNREGIGLSYWSARLNRLAGRYDISVPTRFPAPIDCSKIPALAKIKVYSPPPPHCLKRQHLHVENSCEEHTLNMRYCLYIIITYLKIKYVTYKTDYNTNLPVVKALDGNK